MLNSSVVGDSGKVSVRRSVFSQTCALLGQYMKEKKASGDLSFEMAGNIDGRGSNNAFRHTTMNLFPVNERAEDVPTSRNGMSSVLPQLAGFTASKPNSSEIESAPMTIFYAGQVIVFNDFPAHKAKEVMELASRGISQNPNLVPPTVNTHAFPSSLGNNNQMQEPAQKPDPPTTSDLPISRRASLHRFLEKRKDRITAKAPYSTSKPGDLPQKSKPNESNSWLGLAAAGMPSLQA